MQQDQLALPGLTGSRQQSRQQKPTQAEIARALRDQGIARAASSADRADADWSARALEILRDYARANQHFTAELVRQRAALSGLKDPPDRRAWGSVMLTASRRGWIKADGYIKATDPKVHCNMVTLWASRIFAGAEA